MCLLRMIAKIIDFIHKKKSSECFSAALEYLKFEWNCKCTLKMSNFVTGVNLTNDDCSALLFVIHRVANWTAAVLYIS